MCARQPNASTILTSVCPIWPLIFLSPPLYVPEHVQGCENMCNADVLTTGCATLLCNPGVNPLAHLC